MLRTNISRLVKISVVCEVASPILGRSRYRISAAGRLGGNNGCDHSYGRIYKEGAVSIGIVAHSDCVISEHGPGVTTLFTSSTGKIVPKIDSEANIAVLLNLRKDI